jgi:hypothetical protein
MQTDTITLTCLNNADGFNCTTPSIFSGGEMFISLELLILIVFSMIAMIAEAIFVVSVHKKFIGRYDDGKEGAEIYKI